MRHIVFTAIILLITLFLLLATANAQSIKVMLIDTGIDGLHKSFDSYKVSGDLYDPNGHGTQMASIVLYGDLDKTTLKGDPVCKQVQLISCDYYSNNSSKQVADCIKEAIKQKVYIVNFSSVGGSFDKDEYQALHELELSKIKFITSAGNKNRNIRTYPLFPASLGYEYIGRTLPILHNVITLGASTSKGTRADFSDYGLEGMKFRLGVEVMAATPFDTYSSSTGSSPATAVYTHELLMQKCKELK